MRAACVVMTFMMIIPAVACEPFQFAGLTARATIEQVQARYSSSELSGSHLFISEQDSHDHIYGISVYDHQTLLAFERKAYSGEVSYPLCRSIFNKIFSAYGGPHIVQRFHEETMQTHRRVWRNGDERIALRCFEKGGSRYAERVELYAET